jgi:hypothetical protein
MYFTLFAGNLRFTYDKGDLVFAYRQYRRLMEHWRKLLPSESFLEVDYEEMVEDQEGVTRRMLDFCDLEWDDACMQFFDNDRPIRTASNWQARQPIYKSSMERWRRYEADLGELRELLQD